MKKSFLFLGFFAILNLICWYIFSNSSELDTLRDENKILKSELEHENKRSKRTSSSIQYKNIEGHTNQINKIESSRKPTNIVTTEDVEEELNPKQMEILQDASKVLPPHIIEQFKNKKGRDNMYKNILNDPKLTEALDRLEGLDKDLSSELGDLLDDDEIVRSALTEKHLKDSGDVAPDNVQMKDDQEGLNNSNNSKSNKNDDLNLEK